MSPRINKKDILLLVVAPTRELANQIGAEAKLLLHFRQDAKVAVFVGGTNITKDVTQLNEGSIAVLVTTPGRYMDHLTNTPEFKKMISGVRALVIDEADRLLDMGFKPAVDRIMASLPPKSHRQTMLFSATIPASITEIAKNTLNKDFKTIDTTGLGEQDSGAPHLHVRQELLVAAPTDLVAVLAAVLKLHIDATATDMDYKIMVFFPTARTTALMSSIFNDAGFDVLEMHSRKSQSYREKCSDQFRKGKNVIMFSSDVTARGMDYPGVTFVLQVGMTDKDQYIHRLGRTARAGTKGCGMLLISDFEQNFIQKELNEIPFHRVTTDDIGSLQVYREKFTSVVKRLLAVDSTYSENAQRTYAAWLGFYINKRLGLSKEQIVALGNQFATEVLLLPKVPGIPAQLIGKMGLRGVAGIIVDNNNRK